MKVEDILLMIDTVIELTYENKISASVCFHELPDEVFREVKQKTKENGYLQYDDVTDKVFKIGCEESYLQSYAPVTIFY